MDSVLQMVGLLILVLCSAFFSISEISLAAAKNVIKYPVRANRREWININTKVIN